MHFQDFLIGVIEVKSHLHDTFSTFVTAREINIKFRSNIHYLCLHSYEPGTCILFGDGSGAVVLEASDSEADAGILGFALHSDGDRYCNLQVLEYSLTSYMKPWNSYSSTLFAFS